MITHNLVQGSPEWLAHRRTHRNASDSATVMGVSPYETRSAFMSRMHTGMDKEFSDFVESRILANGHKIEAIAGPLAEKIIGEPLSPVTGSNGIWSASFDGLVFDERVTWENKTMNAELRNVQEAADLPIHNRIQMEHQLMVCDGEKALFTAYKLNEDGDVEEKLELFYSPDLELRARIAAAWDQFDKDFAAYVPPEVIPAAVAAPIMALPALSIQIKGEVTLSNLPQFREAAEQFIANIKTELVTDDDFADAEATVKFCDAAEKNLEQAKNAAIAQTASIDELMRTIDYIKGQLSTKRLILKKLVESEKEARKAAIVADAQHEFLNHLDELYKEIKPIELQVKRPDFAISMKGLKKLSAMKEAVDNALRNGMFEADTVAKDIRAKLAWFKANAGSHDFLFRDLQTIIYKDDDDFKLLVNTRIAEHTAAEAEKLEAERFRMQLEEEKKARATIIEQEQRAAEEEWPPEPVDHTQDTSVARPSSDEIIIVVANHFGVSSHVAHLWLIGIAKTTAAA